MAMGDAFHMNMAQHGDPHFQIFPIKDFPNFSEQCIQLLNEEWPRSLASRQNSLLKSMNSEPPLSMILLDGNNSLIGHARLCPLPSEQNALWIESIIVWKRLRGNGFGKILMQRIENWSQERGFTQLFLSTEDKMNFYKKCGFSPCQPVINFGANSRLFEKNGLAKFLNKSTAINFDMQTEDIKNNNELPSFVPLNPPTTPPPPPLKNCNPTTVKAKIYMTKRILKA